MENLILGISKLNKNYRIFALSKYRHMGEKQMYYVCQLLCDQNVRMMTVKKIALGKLMVIF